MAFKCNTTDGRLWDSTINKAREGKISIESEHSGSGDFEGDHIGARQRIRGNCNQNGIWFFMSAGDPQYFYRGRFISDNEINGTRTTLGTFVKGELGATLAEDEWVATRPVTK